MNINQPTVIGRGDYAACTGEAIVSNCPSGPSSYAQGDSMTEAQWLDKGASYPYHGGADEATGVIFHRSMCRMAEITDGASNTYLLGERYLNPDHYVDGVENDDDQGWDVGYDYDVNRWTNNTADCWPRQDTPGYPMPAAFGSAHAGSFNMAFCDGSATSIGYTIDREIHRRLGSRKDGKPIDGGKF